MDDLRQALKAEVDRFRAWADAFPVAERSGEWECLYMGWQGIYDAFNAFVSTTTYQEWDVEVTQMLLYVIARDNDMQALAKEIAKRPDDLIYLAQQALLSPERDAKWQLAIELGRLRRAAPQVEPLLIQFAQDPDAYVRRCGLVTLADIGSSKVEELVAPAWAIGDEYERASVLYALWKIGSSQLDTYLARADVDGRQHLVAYAERVRAGNPE